MLRAKARGFAGAKLAEARFGDLKKLIFYRGRSVSSEALRCRLILRRWRGCRAVVFAVGADPVRLVLCVYA